MARYDTGAGLNLQRTNASELINEICQGFHQQSQAKNITLNHLPDGKLHILADANAIRRVLENLVSNAIKYTASGGHVELETALTDKDVIIRIKDNGVGIPADQLPRVFERFYRVPSHKEMAEGTGLGMAIVKSIVDKHNGKIEIASIVDQGTSVTVTLPAF
jgi:two-component system sensor histidine kinase VicK